VVFYPYSASLFFPFSLDEINDYSIKIFDIFKDWSEYEDNFFSSTDAVQRIRIIEKFLLKKIINRNYQQYELVKSCINEITKAKGTLPLNNIYSHYNVSEKTIQRLFKQYVGITPKMFSEYIRIGNTVELVKSKMNSTEVSYEAGYYDQSHCIKKLKTYTGCTPIELIKKCDNSDVVFIQSN
jgi:AraC-like DNA-binding protein